jgi:hypothetical protein
MFIKAKHILLFVQAASPPKVCQMFSKKKNVGKHTIPGGGGGTALKTKKHSQGQKTTWQPQQCHPDWHYYLSWIILFFPGAVMKGNRS